MIRIADAARVARLEQLVDRLDAGTVPIWATPAELAERCAIDLDPWQLRVLASSARRLILKGPRQIGKSTVSGLLSLDVALRTPHALVLLLAPAQDQSKELARTVRQLAAALGVAASEQVETLTPTALSASRIAFGNGSRIIALPGRNDATIRGYARPDLIVADEASRIPETTFEGIRPMLVAHPTGRLILLSTPWVKQGTFYRAWTADTDTWERHEVAVDDCPRLTPAYIESERRELPSWVFAREYLGQFGDDDATLFPAELIAAAMDDDVRPLFDSSLSMEAS